MTCSLCVHFVPPIVYFLVVYIQEVLREPEKPLRFFIDSLFESFAVFFRTSLENQQLLLTLPDHFVPHDTIVNVKKVSRNTTTAIGGIRENSI